MGSTDPAVRARANRRYYEGNRQRYLDRNNRYKEAARELVQRVKGSTPCADCGTSYPWWVMDFDHVTDDKRSDIAKMVSGGLSVTSILAEIAKCEVVCSNCHRERTHARRSL